eukprot:TRINITY_DN749_c0_g1_i1.p2 TRINITY_DN749_c0_g1~~TRINITY_DN749_c0_g1_i1.p2  ORF type:complete len:102 (+),score=0.15 TRINITY_DN749_c0_g1_i1:666-971(+)
MKRGEGEKGKNPRSKKYDGEKDGNVMNCSRNFEASLIALLLHIVLPGSPLFPSGNPGVLCVDLKPKEQPRDFLRSSIILLPEIGSDPKGCMGRRETDVSQE